MNNIEKTFDTTHFKMWLKKKHTLITDKALDDYMKNVVAIYPSYHDGEVDYTWELR